MFKSAQRQIQKEHFLKMLKNVVTVKPVPENPESGTPEEKYKSSWIFKYFVWIEVVLVTGGILPSHRPKKRWRRWLMYIYISLIFILHSFNLGRSVALFFTTSIGLTSNIILTCSYLMTWALVVGTSKRMKHIRPFLKQFTQLYERGTIPVCNYQKTFVKFSRYYAIFSVIGIIGMLLFFTLYIYLFYNSNPFLELVVVPLTLDNPITKNLAIFFAFQSTISIPAYLGPCWLFLSLTLVLYKEYSHTNKLIEKSVREKNIRGKTEEYRLHHEKLSGLVRCADEVLNAVTGIYSLSVIVLFCLGAYEVAGGVTNIIIFSSFLLSMFVVIIIWFVIISGCICLNDQVMLLYLINIIFQQIQQSRFATLFFFRHMHVRMICTR